MSTHRKSFDLELKSIEDDGTFTMYAAVFGNVDRGGDVIEPGAFVNLDEFVKSGWIALNHRQADLAVGYPLSAVQDSVGLRVTGKFHTHPEAQACRTMARERLDAGKEVQASIGYVVVKATPKVRDGEPIRALEQVRVYESSFVNLAMNPKAGAVSVKAGDRGQSMPIETDEAGLLAAVKEFFGFLRTKAEAGEMPKSYHTRLKAFAEAMHEHGTKSKEHADTIREHGKAACAMAKAMKEHLKAMKGAADGDAEDDDEDSMEPEEKPAKKKGKKEEEPEDTADGAPPEGKAADRHSIALKLAGLPRP